MTVVSTRVDDWISHLLFTQTRQTDFGPADGLFYGVIQLVGDATGGTTQMTGQISFNRKEDWVYLIQATSLEFNASNSGIPAAIRCPTGPLARGAAGVANPIFSRATKEMQNVPTILATVFASAGHDPHQNLLSFGDKRLTGNFNLVQFEIDANINLATNTGSIWGFLFRYASFFRGVPPGLG